MNWFNPTNTNLHQNEHSYRSNHYKHVYIIHHMSQYSQIQVQRHKLTSIRLRNLLLNLKKLHYWSLESALWCALMCFGSVFFKLSNMCFGLFIVLKGFWRRLFVTLKPPFILWDLIVIFDSLCPSPFFCF